MRCDRFHRRPSMGRRLVMSELTDAVRERYAAKALQMAPGGVTGSLGLACDLPGGQLAQRQAEWRAVDAAALLTRAERSGTVISTYRAGPAIRAELTRLVAAERVCCGTANWSLHDDGAELRVTVDAASGACCEDDCGGATYSAEELASVGIDATASLGCGNPTLLAELRAGETVLDLGSGAGMDVLLSARRVGPTGHAYGVDMTDEMLALAEANLARAGARNATFLKGTIERVPLPDAAVDVVISNCVINLAEDKGAVIREAYRVLKPGGRLAVSDMVELRPLPAAVKREREAWVGCIAGTIPVDEYRQLLLDAGFEAPEIEITGEQDVDGLAGALGSASIRARKSGADAAQAAPQRVCRELRSRLSWGPA